MRDIVAVIDEMKPYIEDEELMRLLGKAQRDSYYKAPEIMWELWEKVSYILSRFIPAPLKNDNQIKIVSIFTTMSEEEVKKQFTEEEK
jgi:hypothetical protein